MFTDLYPLTEDGDATREFLLKIIEVSIDFIVLSNIRQSPVLTFCQPNDLKRLFNFDIQTLPENLQEILNCCKETFKYQVKTGKYSFLYTLQTHHSLLSKSAKTAHLK